MITSTGKRWLIAALKNEITTAKWLTGSVWHTADVTCTLVEASNSLTVQMELPSEVSPGVSCTGVQILNAGGDVLFEREDTISRSVDVSLTYRLQITAEAVDEA